MLSDDRLGKTMVAKVISELNSVSGLKIFPGTGHRSDQVIKLKATFITACPSCIAVTPTLI